MASHCTINARKFDGSLHRSWSAELVEENDELYVLVGAFDREVDHPELGHIAEGTVSHEFYWKEKWFNIFRFHQPDGTFMFFYCNINLPPVFTGDTLDYVDLDIDLLVRSREDLTVLDEEDFERNRQRFGYGQEILSGASEALGELRRMIDAGAFPFDGLPN